MTFFGNFLAIYFVYSLQDNIVASLTGKINERLISHSLKFSLKDEESEFAPVHRLAAKAAIRQMEEEGTGILYFS